MDISKLQIGKKLPEEVNVVVEIPEGSSIKYELDKESGFMMVDRFMFTAMSYPFNYGFIPHTLADDGDPMDVLVLSSMPVSPGCVIAARPIGLLEMDDEAGQDTKILAVPTKKIDGDYADVNDINDIDEITKKKIKHFFEHYKELEKGKWVKTKRFLGKERAFAAILSSVKE
jgi:inorganic pyrophosphatase